MSDQGPLFDQLGHQYTLAEKAMKEIKETLLAEFPPKAEVGDLVRLKGIMPDVKEDRWRKVVAIQPTGTQGWWYTLYDLDTDEFSASVGEDSVAQVKKQKKEKV